MRSRGSLPVASARSSAAVPAIETLLLAAATTAVYQKSKMSLHSELTEAEAPTGVAWAVLVEGEQLQFFELHNFFELHGSLARFAWEC